MIMMIDDDNNWYDDNDDDDNLYDDDGDNDDNDWWCRGSQTLSSTKHFRNWRYVPASWAKQIVKDFPSSVCFTMPL